jgi:hypothetical protein
VENNTRRTLTASSKESLWFRTRGFDLAFFHLPIWLCWVSLLFLPSSLLHTKMPIWGWVVLVLLIDVGHVWATLFRTYFDPEARAHNRDLLLFFPLLCFAGALSLALISEALFWRVLAYIALYHFIKQQYGITALYNVRLNSALIAPAKEPGASPLLHPPKRIFTTLRHLDKLCIYIATGFPILYWHTHLPRKISWFSQGDFVSWLLSLQKLSLGFAGQSVYSALVAVFLFLWVGSALLWLAFHLWLARRYALPVMWGKIFWVLGTYLNWYLGIVHFDSPFVFTLTNVVAHGLPYYGLVYLYTEKALRDQKQGAHLAWQRWQPYFARRAFTIFLFATTILLFAFWEEYLWDLLVHGRTHIAFYGAFLDYPIQAVKSHAWKAFWIALLSVPQATHYFLDGFLWKASPRNPHLKEYLFSR